LHVSLGFNASPDCGGATAADGGGGGGVVAAVREASSRRRRRGQIGEARLVSVRMHVPPQGAAVQVRQVAVAGAADEGAVLQLVSEAGGRGIHVQPLSPGNGFAEVKAFVGNVGVRSLGRRRRKRVVYHVVVQGLRLVGAAHRVEFVFAHGLGVILPLLRPLAPLYAHDVDDGVEHDEWHDADQDQNKPRLAVVVVLTGRQGALQGQNRAVGKDVTMLARVTRQALALEVVDLFDAEAVEARLGGAFVDLLRAVLAGEAGRTGADEVADAVVACATVGAGLRAAVVYIDFAVPADEAAAAIALVIVDEVEAGSAVSARIACAIVDVLLAVRPGESARTLARIAFASGGIGLASASVLAGRARAARIHLDVAVDAEEAGGARATVTGVGGRVVQASSAVLARLVGASARLQLTVSAVVAQGAHALEIVHAGTLERNEEIE